MNMEKNGRSFHYPHFKAGKVAAMAIVDAVTGQFHGASACTVGWTQFPPISETQARKLASVHFQKSIQYIELVWGFCEEVKSLYTPLRRVTFIDESTLFISQKGTLHRQITRHSYIRSELKR